MTDEGVRGEAGPEDDAIGQRVSGGDTEGEGPGGEGSRRGGRGSLGEDGSCRPTGEAHCGEGGGASHDGAAAIGASGEHPLEAGAVHGCLLDGGGPVAEGGQPTVRFARLPALATGGQEAPVPTGPATVPLASANAVNPWSRWL